jgi:hypothetical protein
LDLSHEGEEEAQSTEPGLAGETAEPEEMGADVVAFTCEVDDNDVLAYGVELDKDGRLIPESVEVITSAMHKTILKKYPPPKQVAKKKQKGKKRAKES